MVLKSNVGNSLTILIISWFTRAADLNGNFLAMANLLTLSKIVSRTTSLINFFPIIKSISQCPNSVRSWINLGRSSMDLPAKRLWVDGRFFVLGFIRVARGRSIGLTSNNPWWI